MMASVKACRCSRRASAASRGSDKEDTTAMARIPEQGRAQALAAEDGPHLESGQAPAGAFLQHHARSLQARRR